MLEAIGTAFIADDTTETVSKAANEIQSVGNLFVITGLFRENTGLIIKGNLIQAAGGRLDLPSAINDDNLVNFQGNLLQIIGNSIQAMAGIKTRLDVDHILPDFTGSWIQAIGSVISAINVTIARHNARKRSENLT